MPRYRLTIEYDGRPYQGWQSQAGVPTVQDAIEAAILAFSGERIRLSVAGRTDAGVHATGQVAHADLARDWAPSRARDAINAHLRPQPIAILAMEVAPPTFDARFSAIRRAYRYTILNRRAPPALDAGKVWHVMRELDTDTMHRAAQTLVGTHDFTTFRNARCQAKSPIRTLEQISVRRDGAYVLVETEARSFLHNQVRSMVGSLKRVGDGAWPLEAIPEILAARDRTRCGALAPPEGLALARVDYRPDGGAAPEPVEDDDAELA
jgi:tRNA pseudouridine38-40 synthase